MNVILNDIEFMKNKRSLSSNRRGSPEHIAIIRSGRDLTGEERFWRLVDRRGPEECWPWLGGTGGGHPRGRFWGGKDFGERLIYSHRIAWELLRGPIPDGLVIDHLCRNGLCQNPAHMRLVTQYVNVTENSESPLALNLAKTHCPQGHPYDDVNTAVITRGIGRMGKPGPTRICLTCFPGNWRYAIVPRERPKRALTPEQYEKRFGRRDPSV
jgi:hypothetical protein